MKRNLIIALLLGMLGSSYVASHPRSYQAQYTDRVMFDEGDTAEGFAVSCSSTAWTQIVASDEDSRIVEFQALTANTGGVCISTVTASAIACDDTTPGLELAPAADKKIGSTGAWYCRARATFVGVIKGFRGTDSAD